MVSKKRKASQIVSTIEGLKESKREIQAQHATPGVQISTLEGRISTLEAQLREYVRGKKKAMNSNFSAATYINLKVTDVDDIEVYFRMKRHIRLERLMMAWCNHRFVKRVDAAFLYQGCRLRADQTPEQLEMKDGDEIDALFWL